MAAIRLTLSCGDYDRTRPLIEGVVITPGLDLIVVPLPSAERHTRFVRDLEFDVCEIQVAQYLGLKSRGAPISAIPVFPNRRFNHSCVMVRSDSDIVSPEDLHGRRVGVQGHFNPIALWMRGVLQHEFGVPPSSIQWIADRPERVPDWSPPPWLHIERMTAGESMERLLVKGELDGAIVPDTAAGTSAADNLLRRLWPNYREVEADYYRRTGIFPIRHLVAVRDQVLQHGSEIVNQLVMAFEDAKQQAGLYWADHRRSSLAWFGAEQEEERALLGSDPWAYSVKRSRTALETMLDYAVEQGVTVRRLSLEEIFVSSTLD